MKVIFKDTGEVKDVPDGHARNYLLPKGLAIIANDFELKKIEEKKKKESEEEKKRREELELTAKKIDGKLITVKKKPTNKKISEAIVSQLGFRIDKHNIKKGDLSVETPNLGVCTVDFGMGAKCQINLKILS